MLPTPDFIKKVETDYLLNVAASLRSGEINLTTAKASAQDLLKLLPFQSYEDMENKLKQFTQKYQKFSKVYVNFLNYHEELKTHNLVEKMRDLMKSNKIEEALRLVK